MAQLTHERRFAMFWTFLTFAGLAVVFAQLGAMSVWISVLKIGLLLSLIIIAGGASIFIWRKVFAHQ
jgi:hypothetical protein